MILGGVASGKSSILMALLRELPIKKYKCFDINGSIAYVGQQPWIFSDSLRENILFGKEYDQSLYKLVNMITGLPLIFFPNLQYKPIQFSYGL